MQTLEKRTLRSETHRPSSVYEWQMPAPVEFPMPVGVFSRLPPEEAHDASYFAASASTVFACDAQEDTNIYTPRSSRLVHLSVLDALHVATALALGDFAADNLRRSKDALLVDPGA